MTGEQALNILKSDEMKEFRAKHGDDIPVLVEGRVGVIERGGKKKTEKNAMNYLKELKDAGAIGVVVGGGLASSDLPSSGSGSSQLETLLQSS